MIFEVTPEHIEALSDSDLRTLVGYLAEQETVRAGHSPSNVTYGGHQNAKDGGIDVRVDLKNLAIAGYIPRTQSGFQVKAEDMSASAIQQEMCPGGKLRPAIIELGEVDGAYVIVSSKGSVSDSSLSRRRNAMASAISTVPRAAGLHVDFYDRRRLATWVNQHPGVIPWVRSRVGLPLAGWRPFGDWSSSPGSTDEEYLTDEGLRFVGTSLNDNGLKVVDGLNKLRKILSQPKSVVRLVGLSGVGKTRMVQALFDPKIGSDALTPHVAIYADLADEPDPVPLELLSRLENLGQSCVLIVDNCSIDLHRRLTTRITTGTSAISLITVEYDINDDEPQNTDVFRLEPASNDVIEKVLKRRYTTLTAPEIRTIAAFSEGNFRVALALADTAKTGESLANLKDSDLFQRLFRQKNEDNPALLKAAKVCSLVYSFDGETLEGEAAELSILATLAEQTVSGLHGHVAELYRRQLIQKRSKWRALLPHALAHKLAKQALQDIPLAQLKKSFVEAAPERLLKSFSRRLGCLHDSYEAQALVTEWQGEGGWISAHIGNLNALGMTVLDNVAPVNPGATLRSVQAAADRRPDFFRENVNSAELVKLLRSLAYDAASFDQAVGLIGQFARSKTESNNMGDAINVFKSLFFIVLSGTHASAEQRAVFLRKLAGSGRSEDRQLVLAALDAMLECNHFTSSYGFEFGARKRDYGFHPRNRTEQFNWFRSVLSLCMDLSALPAFRRDVRSMLASQFRFLVGSVPLDDLIVVAEKFASDGGWPEGWAGVRGAVREARQANEKDAVAKLETLEVKLKPGSLSDRIASYVLPPEWGTLDVAEIDLGDEKKYEAPTKQVEKICEGIGGELAHDLDALAVHLPQMLLSPSSRVFIVAGAIGRDTDDPQRAWEIICKEVLAPAHNEKIFTFPGAFLAGLQGKNHKLVEKWLDDALASQSLCRFLINMQISVGIDARGCERLIEVAKLSTVSTHMFGNLSHGRATQHLTGADLMRLLLAIAERPDGLETAIDIFHIRIFSLISDKKTIDHTDRQIARTLLARVDVERHNRHETHDLVEITRTCLVPPEDNSIARQLCERLRDAIRHGNVWVHDYHELVAVLGIFFPRIVLEVLVEQSDGERYSSVFENLGERQASPLRTINGAFLLDWAHEKPQSRFARLAEVITPWEDKEIERDNAASTCVAWTTTAMRLMNEAPDPGEIVQIFRYRLHPSGWSGSLADILTRRVPLLEYLTNDPNQRIAKSAQEAVAFPAVT